MGLAVIAWLLPNHVSPWSSFYNEAVFVAALWLVGAWQLVRSPAPVAVPMSAAFFSMLATVPILQSAFGLLRYSGDALLASSYLAGLAICIAMAANWRCAAPAQAARLLQVTLALAAVASTQLALLQWLRLDMLGVLLADLPYGARPTGNIAQANHLASLLFLGLIAIWGLHLREAIRPAVSIIAAAFLLFGMALTQSRTGWVEMGLLMAAAFVWHRPLKSRSNWPGLLGLALSFIALVTVWPSLNTALYLDGGLTLADQFQTGRRPVLWYTLTQAIWAAPWWGYGWTQVGLAQQAVALTEPGLHLVFTFAHNLALDLLIWNGVPIGLMVCALLAVWLWRRLSSTLATDEALFLLALLGLLAHAMFEFPHAYTYFLFTAGLLVGMLPSGRVWFVNRGAAVGVMATAFSVGYLVIADYVTAEQAWLQVRMDAARIRSAPGTSVEPLRWLDQIQGLVDQSRIDPTRNLDVDRQAAFRKSVERFPAVSSQLRLAQMEAHHGRRQIALQELQKLCSMHPPQTCVIANEVWRNSAMAPPDTRPNRMTNPAEPNRQP